MKWLLILFSFCLVNDSISSDKVTKRLIKAAINHNQLWLSNLHEDYCKVLHPVFLDSIGGCENLSQKRSAYREYLKANNFLITNVTIHDSRILDIRGDTITAVLTLSDNIINGGTEYIYRKFLLALSYDQGKTWLFIDTRMALAPSYQHLVPHVDIYEDLDWETIKNTEVIRRD